MSWRGVRVDALRVEAVRVEQDFSPALKSYFDGGFSR
jgi:hypothetical protein